MQYDLEHIKGRVISGKDNEEMLANILEWVRRGGPKSIYVIRVHRSDDREEVATIYYEHME